MSKQYFSTVSEAIQKGKLNLITVPRVIAVTGFVISSIAWSMEIGKTVQNKIALNPLNLFMTVGIGSIGLLAAFMWRNFHSVAWKIWALQNVQDVHRLYQVAQQQIMINKRDSWLNVFEIKSREQKEQLADLETRLDRARQEEGASTPFLPDECSFRYSINMLLWQLSTAIPILIGAQFVFHKIDIFPVKFLLLFLFGTSAYRWLPRIGKPAPIQLNRTGIRLNNSEQIPWIEVSSVALENRPKGRGSVTMLVLKTSSGMGHSEIDISEIEGRSDEIEQVVYDFWARGRG